MASNTKRPLGSSIYCAQYIVDTGTGDAKEPVEFNYFYGSLNGLKTGVGPSLERSGQPAHFSGTFYPVVKLYVIEHPKWEPFRLPEK